MCAALSALAIATGLWLENGVDLRAPLVIQVLAGEPSPLRELKRDQADIEAIVLTHAHFDHMGFARRGQEELGVPLYAHEKEVHVVRHPWDYDHEQPLRF